MLRDRLLDRGHMGIAPFLPDTRPSLDAVRVLNGLSATDGLCDATRMLGCSAVMPSRLILATDANDGPCDATLMLGWSVAMPPPPRSPRELTPGLYLRMQLFQTLVF